MAGKRIADSEVRDALRRQWARIGDACPHLDLDRPSRIAGWRNAEVLAHLSVQPVLLGRFLRTAGPADAMPLEQNLAGTRALAAAVDDAAREAARAGRVDFARNAAAVDDALLRADLGATVVTVQGAILLVDYLRTRCVEGVVHGRDLQPPVAPDPVAEEIAVSSLLSCLVDRPDALDAVRELPADQMLDVATGRAPAPPELADVLPLMT